MGNRSGVRIYSTRVKNLHFVLKEWIAINRWLGFQWQYYQELPWWNNERASISILAGAAWKCGWYAYKDYSAEKTEKKCKYPGFIDLEIGNQRRCYQIEAKQIWLGANKQNDRAATIQKKMDIAISDVGKCPSREGRRLAVVFGSPKMSEGYRNDLGRRISWLIAEGSKVEVDAYAWVFPKLHCYPRWNHNIYPGAMLWITQIHRD